MNTFTKYALSLLGISLVIGVHELGHFSFSKLFGVHVPTFSIGFGPPLASTSIGDTRFYLRVLPLGGYVTIAGYDEDSSQQDVPEKSQFYTKPYYQKILIILGGIFFNIGFGLLMLLLFNAPSVFRSMRNRLREKGYLNRSFIGPIGIINIIAETASYGAPFYWTFLGALSLNLAFFNLLPIPFFDGGQIVSITIQAAKDETLSEGAKINIAILLLLLMVLTIYTIITSVKRSASRRKPPV